MTSLRPRLSFACELESAPLSLLFDTPGVFDSLQRLEARICLGLIDLSDQRAEVVRRLNQAGIPVVAWLLLPKDQGYWFNLDNAHLALARYEEFKAWAIRYELSFEGIGLDIEPDIRLMRDLIGGNATAVPHLLAQITNSRRYARGRSIYLELIARARESRWSVEAYHFPVMIDERVAGSTVLQRVIGLVDLPVDREIFMLYSSFTRNISQGVLWSYARSAGPRASIGIGVTGGGVDLGNNAPDIPLTWAEFQRDLLQAYQFKDDLFIFSLEGCVEHGYLERLEGFKWDQPVLMPVRAVEQVDRVRKLGQMALWTLARPQMVIGGALALYGLYRLLRPRR